MHPFTNSIFPILGEQASAIPDMLLGPPSRVFCMYAYPHAVLVHLRGNFIVGQALDFCNKHDQYHMSGALEVYGC